MTLSRCPSIDTATPRRGVRSSTSALSNVKQIPGVRAVGFVYVPAAQ